VAKLRAVFNFRAPPFYSTTSLHPLCVLIFVKPNPLRNFKYKAVVGFLFIIYEHSNILIPGAVNIAAATPTTELLEKRAKSAPRSVYRQLFIRPLLECRLAASHAPQCLVLEPPEVALDV